MVKVKTLKNIEVAGINLKLTIYEDGNFSLSRNNEEVKEVRDNNGMRFYYFSEVPMYIFKHEIARDFILEGDGTHIVYLDNDYNNLKLSNLAKCSEREYRTIMVNRSKEYDKNKRINRESRQNDIHKACSVEQDVFYQIKLPNGDKEKLKKNNTIEDKIKIVEDILNDWQDEIEKNWKSDSIKYFLSSLGNYLVWHVDYESPIPRNREILSNRKTNRLIGLEKDLNLTYFESSPNEREMYY